VAATKTSSPSQKKNLRCPHFIGGRRHHVDIGILKTKLIEHN